MKTTLLYTLTAFAAALLLLVSHYCTQPAHAASVRNTESGAEKMNCISLSKPATSIFHAKHPLDFLMK